MQEEEMEGKKQGVQKLHYVQQTLLPEVRPCSDNPVLKEDALMTDIINTALGNFAVNMNLTDSLLG